MDKRPIVALSLFLALVLVSQGSSADVDVYFEEMERCEVTPHNYSINITNRRDVRDIFSISFPEPYRWGWVRVPRDQRQISLEPNETETINVEVDPPAEVELGEKRIEFLVKSRRDPSIVRSYEICFIVLRDYSMLVHDVSKDRNEYKPRESIKYEAVVENDGTKNFDDGFFKVELLKDNETIDSNKTNFDLETGKTSNILSFIETKKHQEPGEYMVEFEVGGAGKTIRSGEDTIKILEVDNWTISEEGVGGYIVRDVKIYVENDGNTIFREPIERTFRMPLSLLATSEDGEVIREGLVTSLIWSPELEPGEEMELEYNLHFWPIYILLLLLAVLVFRVYMYLKAPTVKKEVRKSEISENKRLITISLEVRNRLFGKAENVILEDALPSVARVVEKFDTLEPSIDRRDEETKLRWKLGEIEAGDSRIIHYKAKVLVESVDELILPAANVRGTADSRFFERSSKKAKLKV